MSLSQPEFAADGKTIGALVYFSSASENTARFVAGCRLQDEGINVYRIPLRAAAPALNVRRHQRLSHPSRRAADLALERHGGDIAGGGARCREPYVIMVPTHGGGVVKTQCRFRSNASSTIQPTARDSRRHRLRHLDFGEAYCARRRHHRRQMPRPPTYTATNSWARQRT